MSTTALNIKEKYNDNYLALALASYIILLMFFGRFEAFQEISIWVMGPIFSVLVIANYAKRPFDIPKEVMLLGIFWLWVFPGYVMVLDFEGYFRYVRLLFTIIVLFFCVEIVLVKTGNLNLICKALILNSLLFCAYNYIVGGFSPEEGNEFWRLKGLDQTSNGFAIFSLVGLIGILFLWREARSLPSKIFYILSIVLFVTTIILTASRSTFITALVIFGFWILLCYKEKFVNNMFIFVFLLILSSTIIWFGYSYIMDETYLGDRFGKISEPDEDLTGEVRFLLYEEGFEMFKESPLYGVGLSQFKARSAFNSYSHSLYMELLSTTGLGGFLIMLTFYIVIFRRIQKLKKVIKNTDVLYKLNFSTAVLLGLAIFGLFNVSFLDIVIMLQFAVVAGYSSYLVHQYREYIEEELIREKYSKLFSSAKTSSQVS